MSRDLSLRPKGSRAALKSNWAGHATDNLSEATAHFGQEGWAGAIPSARLAARPSPRLTLHGATEDAQNGGRDWLVDSTAVLPHTDIQGIMGAVFDAPVLARQLQEMSRIGLI
jgi:hypothetical protein